MTRQIDWDNVTEEDLEWLRNNNGYDRLRLQGIDPESVLGESYDVTDLNDMSGVPPTPPASKLDEQGMRHTVTEEGAEGDEDLPPYSEWTKAELVAETQSRGLDSHGSKAELVARLESHDDEMEATAAE